MADAGFRAFEDNGMMKRPIALQQQMGDLLAKRGLTMGVFVIDGGDNWKVSLTTGKPEFVDVFAEGVPRRGRGRRAHEREVDDGRARLLRARTCRWASRPGTSSTRIRRGADILAPHGLVMVLEPLSDNPDLFLRTPDEATRLPGRQQPGLQDPLATCITCSGTRAA